MKVGVSYPPPTGFSEKSESPFSCRKRRHFNDFGAFLRFARAPLWSVSTTHEGLSATKPDPGPESHEPKGSSAAEANLCPESHEPGGFSAAKTNRGTESHDSEGLNAAPHDFHAESRINTHPTPVADRRQPASTTTKRRNSNDPPIHDRQATAGPAPTPRGSTTKPPITASNPTNPGDSTHPTPVPRTESHSTGEHRPSVAEPPPLCMPTDHHHRSVGRKLVETGKHATGSDRPVLWVMTFNANARGFYQHTGFRRHRPYAKPKTRARNWK